MTAPKAELLQALMRACIASSPEPLYPKEVAERLGVDRDVIDAALDRLRLNGAVELTEWVSGKGQGYQPTEQGLAALKTAAALTVPLPPPKPQYTPRGLSEYERGEEVRAVFERPRPAVLTNILIFLNVGIFVLGLVLCRMRQIPLDVYLMRTGAVRDMVDVGQLSRDMGSLNLEDYFMRGEWWRLFSYQFLHGGIVHLLFNMFALYSLGQLVENMWGWKKMLLIYLYSGVAGGCFALLFSSGNLVGASAAIYGILTSVGVWVYLNRRHLGTELPPLIFRNLRNMLILMVLISLAPGISLAGHAGGAIGGVLLAYPLHALGSLRDLRRPAVWLLPLVLAAPVAAVQWQFGQDEGVAMDRAEWLLLDVHNQVLLPAFRAQKQFESPDVAERATRLLPQARAAVNSYQARLNAQMQSAQGELKKEIEDRLRYLDSWKELLDALDETLKMDPAERDKDWDDIVAKLSELRAQMTQARNTVRKSKLLTPPGEWLPVK